MRTKALHLRRETLTELADVQLGNVAGGVTTPTCACGTQWCWSLDHCELPRIPSVPVRDCPFS